MKRILFVLVLVLAAISVYWFMLRKKESGPKAPKPVAIALKKHSEAFNKSVDKVVGHYLAVKDAFVESDTTAAKQHAKELISALDSIPLEELKKDTASIFETAQGSVGDIRSNAQSLLQQTNITEMRRDFSMVTDMMYPSFFKSINYEGEKLYLQNCPSAFGEDQQANWISNSSQIISPYIDKSDPKYQAVIQTCTVKDSVMAK
jgi:hypothetical protein